MNWKLSLQVVTLLVSFVATSAFGQVPSIASEFFPDGEPPSAGYPSIRGVTKAELTRYVPAKSSAGLTLIPTEGDRTIHLVDAAGKVVHQWRLDAERARMLPGGSLLVLHGTDWGRAQIPTIEALRPVIREYGIEGSQRWEYRAESPLHHDLHPLPNGNVLLLRHIHLPSPAELQERFGHTAAFRRSQGRVRTDEAIEVTRAGEVVWRWSFDKHFTVGSCGDRPCGKKSSARPAGLDWTHTNTIVAVPENRWYRAGHAAFRPGNILLLPRNWSTVLIVEKTSGKVVWRYDGDDRGGLGRPHEAHIIPEGLPGAGNLLLFDNGVGTHDGRSIIIEVNPVTKKTVWSYEAGETFFSRTRGAVQRLPNGNTLISEDRRGRCFEVTPEGEIVWLYQMPRIINRCSRYPTNWLRKG